MDIDFFLLKTVHIISATLLFGTGIGTAFHMWMTHLTGDARAIASTAKNVVLADWLFTATSGVVQPITGFAMIGQMGYDPWEAWLIASYLLYGVAASCWFVVVRLQMRVSAIATECVNANAPLPPEYHRAMRAWFWLGWPAFVALIAIFGLMVFRPPIW